MTDDEEDRPLTLTEGLKVLWRMIRESFRRH